MSLHCAARRATMNPEVTPDMRMLLILAVLIAAAMHPRGASSDTNKTPPPYTSFQTPTEYRADNDIRTDAAIVYSDDASRVRSWQDKGYIVQTMYGFRTGEDYIKAHPEEAQTAADGAKLTCGPGSYYMVPTQRRIDAAVAYFANAIAGGTSAVIPEEPEFFTQAGYSESFKKAWQRHYKQPWQDQISSIHARYASERLKARMEYDMVRSIMEAAKKQKESVRRMVACHSPVNYYAWGIIYPHYKCLMIPSVQEIIGQVWTGTARTPCAYAGVSQERTFELALLEYSSLHNLVRGTGKRMWFLMDPLEDNPDRTMEDYHSNYEKTLVAALMFPEVDAYEVMPWPTRIYGRVPDEFATEIGTIVAALQDMHNQADHELDAGTQGIATFVADSMGWQRGEPHRGSFDCFYGLTLPLVYDGIPVQVAQLEHSTMKGYLDVYKVLLLSYDIMKPMSAAYNQALVDWVKRGGVLVSFGGTDAYNGLDEWWTKSGHPSPQADLYSRLGVKARPLSIQGISDSYKQLAREKRRLRNLENQKDYTFELTRFAGSSGTVFVRLRDAFADDGWGPALSRARLTIDGKTAAEFAPGTPQERPFIDVDSGSAFNGTFRFADADAYWVYRFDVPRAAEVKLEMNLGNQFVVEASDKPTLPEWQVVRSLANPLTIANPMFSLPARFPLTHYKVAAGELYHVRDRIGATIFEHRFGKGMLVHVGVSPAYFASSPEAAGALRDIVAYACRRAGIDYEKKDWFAIRRGRYHAVRTLDGEKKLQGRFVNLLDPKLGVRIDPVVPKQKCALFYEISPEPSRSPRLLYSSSKVESRSESADLSVLRLSGPLKTKGVARFYTAGRQLESVQPEDVTAQTSGDTALLAYDNVPEGIQVSINWR